MSCEKTMDAIDKGVKLSKEEFKQQLEISVDALVGYATKEQIAAASGSEKKRLIMLNLLNSTLFNDILRVGNQAGFAMNSIEDQISGWGNYLYRFNGGTLVRPQTVALGPKRVFALTKAVNKATKKRDMNIKKALKTGRADLSDRAFARPDVFMSLWDKFGHGQRLVRRAMSLGENAQQIFHKFYGAVGSDNDRIKVNVKMLLKSKIPPKDNDGNPNENAGEPILSLKNAGVGNMKYHDSENAPILIKDYKEEDGVPLFHIKRDGVDEAWHWEGSSVVPLTIEQYESELIELISSEFADDIANGQVRNVFFKTISSKEMAAFRKTEEGELVTELMTKDYARNNVTVGGKTYQFVMVKQGEAKAGDEVKREYYNAYIVNGDGKDFFRNYDGNYLGHDNIEMPGDAYFKSNTYRKFKEGNTFVPQFTQFIRMQTQPNEKIVGDDSVEGSIGLWSNLALKRIAMRGFFDWKVQKSRESEEQMQATYSRLIEKHGEEKAQIKFKELIMSGNVKTRAYFDDDGELHTGNFGFSDVGANYMPQRWRKEVITEMIEDEIANITDKLSKSINPEEMALLEQQLEHFNTVLNFDFDNPGDDREEINRVILARTILGNKHRQLWTDPLLRRKDGAVLSDALHNDIQVIMNNEIVNDMVSTVETMISQGTMDDVIQYVVNKVKQAIGDADTRGIDKSDNTLGSYVWLAERMNRYIPEAIKRGRVFDAESARKLVMHIGGIQSIRFLGMSGAIGNNTQIINPYIRYGYKILKEAMKLNDSTDAKVQDQINNAMGRLGVENVLTMMENYMTSDVEAMGTDYFLYPGTIVPGPNAIKWAKLLNLSNKDFANSTDAEMKKVDAFLAKVQKKYPGNKDKDVVYMRSMLHNLLTMDKKDSQNRKMVEKRLKALLGDVAEQRFKAMVTWKLSWWFDKKPGKEFFTFTEGEKRMRRITAIAAILDANAKGIIPGEPGVYDIFQSDAAIEIGRKAVFAQMFGMSTPYMGEAFDGFMRLLFQYKTYPLQQAQFEYDVMRSFIYGNEDAIEGAERLITTQMQIMKDVAKKAAGKKVTPYSPNNKKIDYEAVQMLRLIYTRFFISGLSTFIGLIPFLGMAMRKIGPFAQGFSMVRSGESPAFSVILKAMLWTILISMGYDPDDDDKYGKALKSSQRGLLLQTTPAFLGAIARDVTDSIEWGEKIADDPTPGDWVDNPLINT